MSLTINRTLVGAAADVIAVTEDLQVDLTNGSTGRTATHFGPGKARPAEVVGGLARQFVNGDTGALEERLKALVGAFNSKADLGCVMYRAVKAEKFPSNVRRIGPPPDHLREPGRYNQKDEQCLYLCQIHEPLARELKQQGKVDLLVQPYNIPSTGLRVADLTVKKDDLTSEKDEGANELELILQLAEGGSVSAFNVEDELVNNHDSRYAFSQTVARAFVANGWDGMLVAGVHGQDGRTYANLVLIGTCVSRWEEWTGGDYCRKPYNE